MPAKLPQPKFRAVLDLVRLFPHHISQTPINALVAPFLNAVAKADLSLLTMEHNQILRR